jgi:hypothetical protein
MSRSKELIFSNCNHTFIEYNYMESELLVKDEEAYQSSDQVIPFDNWDENHKKKKRRDE